MSSMLYSLFTLDTVKYDQILKKQRLYKLITGKKLRKYKIKEHSIQTYIDDMQHIVAGNNFSDVRMYIQDMYDMIVKLYNHNSLQLNGEKTEFLNFSRGKDNPEANFHIFYHKGNILKQRDTIKILGYTINKANDLDNHMSILYG